MSASAAPFSGRAQNPKRHILKDGVALRRGQRYKSPYGKFPAGPVVQRSEPAAHNGVVAGSNPAGPTNIICIANDGHHPAIAFGWQGFPQEKPERSFEEAPVPSTTDFSISLQYPKGIFNPLISRCYLA